MADQEEIYKGRKIVIQSESSFPQLWIDGKNIDVSQTADRKAFLTKAAPYVSYGSLMDLAKHLIDRSGI